MKQDPAVRAEVVATVVDRAPEPTVVGGHGTLRSMVERIIDEWIMLSDEATANGDKFHYGFPQQRALLHEPLDPLLDNLDQRFKHFRAGRSMRDVEHSSLLKIIDQNGIVLARPHVR